MLRKRIVVSVFAAVYLAGSVALSTFASASPIPDDAAQTAPVSNGIELEAPEDQVHEASQASLPETWFTVRIENISGDSAFPVPFAPGVWVVHSEADPLFAAGEMDRGLGLEAIAEDGDPSSLAAALAGQAGVEASGVFNTPVGASGPGPLLPGQAYEFTFSTTMTTSQLSLATMFVHSNDVFASPDGEGISLFGSGGTLQMGERDVTTEFTFWDAGTEVNEAPGMGPNQAPHQAGPDTGAAEDVVHPFDNTTRGLPLADGVADVSVTEAAGTFTVTVENVSADRGSITTPIAPVFYATHAMTWSLFVEGESAGTAGLEALAEDGSPADLVASYTGVAGIGMVGAQDTPVGGVAGPAVPGQSYQFTVTPDGAHRFLTIAFMVVQTNDVFVALGSEGVALLDESGAPRPAADINADVEHMLAVWDAGTEANEVPGVGLSQAPRQAGPNVGASDPITRVRRYADTTNDLAGPGLGGFAEVSVVAAEGPLTRTFFVTVTNTSDATAYPGLLTPVLWATHNPTASLFTNGMMASAELESLAEDGDASALLTALIASSDVSTASVAGVGPIAAGGSIVFSVTLDSDYRRLSIASMVVPSNDTIMAFGSDGIELLTAAGERRSNEDIAADIEASLAAWDAGTERNQAGAAGPDQAPRQAGPNTGADEGNSTVRLLNDPVWRYPMLSDVLRVTIMPHLYRVFLPLVLSGSG
jgi:hypothetical protein